MDKHLFWLYFFIELTFLNEILHKHVKLHYNYEKEKKNPNMAVFTQNFNKRMEMTDSKIIGQTKYVFKKKFSQQRINFQHFYEDFC